MVPRFEELRDAAAQERPGPPGADRRRADLLRDRDPLGPRRGPADALARQRDLRRRLFALAARARHRARRDRHASRGPTTASSTTSTPSTTAASSKGCSTSRAATTRSRCTSTSACAAPTARCARLRPAAPGAAAAARDLGQLAVRRRARHRPALGAHPDVHEVRFPRCGVPDAFGSWAAYRDYIDLLVRTRSIVEYTQVWWSVRPHFSLGTVEVRICDAQSTAGESEALAALIVACVAQAARDVDEGVPFDDPAPRLIEENIWRAIRYGLDGNLIDLDARRGDPGRRGRRAAAGAGRRRCAPSWASSVALPRAPNGAQRQRPPVDAGAISGRSTLRPSARRARRTPRRR